MEVALPKQQGPSSDTAPATKPGGQRMAVSIPQASVASGNFQNVLDKNDLLEAIHKSSK